MLLQQPLPFTVLKLRHLQILLHHHQQVATALTVYGIETRDFIFHPVSLLSVATALTVYGIETYESFH